ncbi:MAG: hypothetical protein LIO79_04095, partial [Rikenellaceae bacterium]|nr:hypothetical protein [Rikenellaceae bacterium]
ALWEESRNAGKAGLDAANRELMQELNRNGSNDGHHNYISSETNMQEYEKNLRNAYPGQSEEFYTLGKWQGLTLSTGFDKLPKKEQEKIKSWLINNGL